MRECYCCVTESDGGWGSALSDESDGFNYDSDDGICAVCGKSEWDCECEEEEDDDLLPILGSYDAWNTDQGFLLLHVNISLYSPPRQELASNLTLHHTEKLLLGGVTKKLIGQIRSVMGGCSGLGWADALCLLQHVSLLRFPLPFFN